MTLRKTADDQTNRRLEIVRIIARHDGEGERDVGMKQAAQLRYVANKVSIRQHGPWSHGRGN